MRRRGARHGIALTAALGVAVLLAACANGNSGTAGSPSSTTGSTTPAQALDGLESTLHQLGPAAANLRATLLAMEGAALNGGGTSDGDIKAATDPVVGLLTHASDQLEAARGALPSSISLQAAALAGALAKSLIDFNATGALAGSTNGASSAFAPTPTSSPVSGSTLAGAYLTDVTELQQSQGSAVAPFLAALGIPSG